MSRASNAKRAAYHAGELHADGGDDTRAHWAHMGRAANYDAGYRDHSARLAENARAEDDPYEVIRALLAACSGEVEEVFAGELGPALKRARALVGES